MTQAEFEASKRQQLAEIKIKEKTKVKLTTKPKQKQTFSFLADFFDSSKFEAFFWEFCFLPESAKQL